MRHFGTQGRVYPEEHYIVPRTKETANFIDRVKDGKYIVLFAPRQTGKTTFFRLALEDSHRKGSDLFPNPVGFPNDAKCLACGFLR